jgi:hypothetical protein
MYLEPCTSREQDIEHTLRLGALPSPLVVSYNTHDVASLFKHFLSDLQGGVLGSVDLFDSLRKALGMKISSEDDMDFQCRGLGGGEERSLRWVGRILCNDIKCHQRKNLIFAVFGLLAHLKHDRPPRDSFGFAPPIRDLPFRHRKSWCISAQIQHHCGESKSDSEFMSSKTLAVVFAPLLLGNLTDEIWIDPSRFATMSAFEHQRTSLLAKSPRKKLAKSMSTMHLRRQSKDTSIHTSAEIQQTSPFINYPLYSEPTKATQKRIKKKSIENLEVPTELTTRIQRNAVAREMLELLIMNWEGVIREVRGLNGRHEHEPIG